VSLRAQASYRSAILALATVSIVFATSALFLFAARKKGRIAFIKVPDLYIMDADGSNVRQLTSFGPDKSATLPSWAPNDEELVFTVTPADSPAELWIMNSDGTHQRLLVGDRTYSNTAASFSSDGHSIVFARCIERQMAKHWLSKVTTGKASAAPSI
jgi:Tol biopolymer transport system component